MTAKIYTRKQLLSEIVAPLVAGETGVEVGTHLGGFAEQILKRTELAQLYCIDPYPGDCYPHMDACAREEAARVRLARFGARAEFIILPSLEAVQQFATASLAFVYIDAQHWEKDVLDDCRAWWPKVREGGVLAGHDYHSRGRNGVIPAVKAFFADIGHEYTVCEPRESHPTWWAVKGEA